MSDDSDRIPGEPDHSPTPERHPAVAAIDAEISRLQETKMIRQCVATNRAGTRCRLAPIPGGTVCHLHGGKAPAVVAAAKRRLLDAVDPVVTGLLEIFEDKNHVEPRDRIRTGFGILDRAGLTPDGNVKAIGVVNQAGGNVMLYMPENNHRAATFEMPDEDEPFDEDEP